MKRRLIACALSFSVVTGWSSLISTQASAQSSQVPAYRINPGDELEVSVWGEERLQRVVKVLPDGTFAFPLVGQVVAMGKLPAEVENRISEGLKPQYRGVVPQVTVSVKSPSGFQFSVIGKVRGPGTFTPGRYINALEALTMAGGPSEFAQVNDIRIVRKEGQQLRSLRVRLGGVLKGQIDVNADDIPAIRSGDTLIVP